MNIPISDKSLSDLLSFLPGIDLNAMAGLSALLNSDKNSNVGDKVSRSNAVQGNGYEANDNAYNRYG